MLNAFHLCMTIQCCIFSSLINRSLKFIIGWIHPESTQLHETLPIIILSHAFNLILMKILTWNSMCIIPECEENSKKWLKFWFFIENNKTEEEIKLHGMQSGWFWFNLSNWSIEQLMYRLSKIWRKVQNFESLLNNLLVGEFSLRVNAFHLAHFHFALHQETKHFRDPALLSSLQCKR